LRRHRGFRSLLIALALIAVVGAAAQTARAETTRSGTITCTYSKDLYIAIFDGARTRCQVQHFSSTYDDDGFCFGNLQFGIGHNDTLDWYFTGRISPKLDGVAVATSGDSSRDAADLAEMLHKNAQLLGQSFSFGHNQPISRPCP
jgi:hypothetical protein